MKPELVTMALSPLLLALSAATARADDPPPVVAQSTETKDPPFEIGSKAAWFVTGGVTSGATIVAHGGGYIGGELSLVRLERGAFIGLYGDGYHDLGVNRTYATGGLELGYGYVGVDGGLASRIGGDRIEWGGTGRLFFTIGILSVYGRYAYFPEPLTDRGDHVVQIGGLFKLPFAAWGGR